MVQDFFRPQPVEPVYGSDQSAERSGAKRRLSALGPGGLSRERAGFEVRDVHSSHYGRICPIETPEGPNIGLISSLSIYAQINEFGFIETPYRVVRNGKVTNEVQYLSADVEEKYVIAQANSELNPDGSFVSERVTCRVETEFEDVDRMSVEYMDVSPIQLVSIAAGLIPFLEHDDANRALMGANMMRQAVPLLRCERPFVATGLEARAAADSCVTVLSESDGVVAYVSARDIVVTPNGKMPSGKPKKNENAKGIYRYALQKFRRCNAGTCFNQKPVVKVGQKVKTGDVLADGPATCEGELALGKNLLVAFMPWSGYNFEDAIVVSERVVRDDVFTSIHIQDFEVGARDYQARARRDHARHPQCGRGCPSEPGAGRPWCAWVPKCASAIFWSARSRRKARPSWHRKSGCCVRFSAEKAADVRDTSLTVPSGVYGIVMDVKVTSQQEVRRPFLPPAASPEEERRKRFATLRRSARRSKRLWKRSDHGVEHILLGENIPLDVLDVETGDIIIPANRKITKTLLSRLAKAHDHIQIESSPVQQKIEEIINGFRPKFDELKEQESGDGEFAEQDGLRRKRRHQAGAGLHR